MAKDCILISGAGIAGPTLAWWLIRQGFQPIIVERAPALRPGGYIIDFWGPGYDVAERMGLLPDLERVGYHVRELRMVDARGRRAGGFDVGVLDALTGGRFISLPRTALARLIFEQIERDGAEIRFGDSIVALQEDADGVQATFERGDTRRFAAVVGADGLHSVVRRLAFGPQARFERPLGYTVAAFECAGYRPRDESVYVMYGQPGLQVARFAMRDDRTLFLFVFTSDEAPDAEPMGMAAQKAIVARRFRDAGWECAPIIRALEQADEIYFDRVSQIRMDRWSRGRIGLVGDAAYCVSLVAGQGAALAMTGAYVLAGEMAAAQGRPDAAFAAYEQRLRGYVDGKLTAAQGFARSFVPRTRLGLLVREKVTSLFRIPGVARLVLGRTLVDRLTLPDYGGVGGAEREG